MPSGANHSKRPSTIPCAGSASAASPSDGDLIRACCDGSDAAWRTLVARYERLVYSVIRRLGVPDEITDDVFQEVWMGLLRQLPLLRHEPALPRWLITTTRRIAIRLATRHRRRSAGAASADTIDTSACNAEDDAFVARMEEAQLVSEALAKLEPRCRDLLMALVRDDDVPYAAISRQLEMPVGSIGPKRARCLQQLLELLGPSFRPAGADRTKADP
ncbi:MAG: sigma-70 family RNA polymerase sigma factor [Phycisphaerae bacterium]|nr:sigma-70 family RNA polymerase sigma factor [Phycisphaerae bacterium]